MSALATMLPEIRQALESFLEGVDRSSAQAIIMSLAQKYKTWWLTLYREAPAHVAVETALVFFIIWLVFVRRTVDPAKISESKKFSEKEVKWLVDTWTPEPLVPALNDRRQRRVDAINRVVTSADGGFLTVKGINAPMLNLSSYDFLNLASHPEAKETSRKALLKYGVGSCGPRGFYGTIDVHLDFEKAIAEHFGVQEAIAYSDGNSAVSSTITAFAKRGDLLLIDEACGEAIRTGANLSRAHVHYFKHNDVESLREIMASVAADDKRLKRDSTQQRRFILVEGLYRSTGNICPLDQIMALKEEYCYRILLDESTSFGCIGPTGRGVAELYGIAMNRIEMFTISMATVLGAVGGVSLGTREIVDHQRLSGPGYCFSASAPPFFSAAALTNLAIIQNENLFAGLIRNLERNIAEFRDSLKGTRGFALFTSSPSRGPASPVLHLALDETDSSVANLLAQSASDNYWDAHESIIVEVVNECNMSGVGVSVSFHQDDSIEAFEASGSAMRPTIRLCVTSGMEPKDIKFAAKIIKTSASRIMDEAFARKK